MEEYGEERPAFGYFWYSMILKSRLKRSVRVAGMVCLVWVITACQHGYYVPRTANVPYLDSTKKSDVHFRPSMAVIELQQNHLFAKRCVFQNNISFRSMDRIGVMGEAAMGYYFEKNYNSLLLLGAGYSYQNYEYLLSDWLSGDGSYITVYLPKQQHYFLQFSKRVEALSKPWFIFTLYERIDFCQLPDARGSQHEDISEYLVQDFGFSVYLREFRFNTQIGLKLPYASTLASGLGGPLLQHQLYCRFSFQF